MTDMTDKGSSRSENIAVNMTECPEQPQKDDQDILKFHGDIPDDRIEEKKPPEQLRQIPEMIIGIPLDG